MEQISQNISTTYKTTADGLELRATKRIDNGKFTVGASINKDDKPLVSLYIDGQQKSTTITFDNELVFSDEGTVQTLKTNLIDWVKQLIEVPAETLPVTE